MALEQYIPHSPQLQHSPRNASPEKMEVENTNKSDKKKKNEEEKAEKGKKAAGKGKKANEPEKIVEEPAKVQEKGSSGKKKDAGHPKPDLQEEEKKVGPTKKKQKLSETEAKVVEEPKEAKKKSEKKETRKSSIEKESAGKGKVKKESVDKDKGKGKKDSVEKEKGRGRKDSAEKDKSKGKKESIDEEKGKKGKKEAEKEKKETPKKTRSAGKVKKEVEEEPESNSKGSLGEGLIPNKRNAYQVMFTGFDKTNDVTKLKKDLAAVGAKIVDDLDKNFTIVVMDEFKRTIKFLYALNRGVDIVSVKWVHDSIKNQQIMPIDKYAYHNKQAENSFKFNLKKSLELSRAKKEKFLEGCRVWLPENINPSMEEVKSLVVSGGGEVIKTKPTGYREDTLIVVNEGDQKSIDHFVGVGYKVYGSELIFAGCLRQTFDLKDHILGQP